MYKVCKGCGSLVSSELGTRDNCRDNMLVFYCKRLLLVILSLYTRTWWHFRLKPNAKRFSFFTHHRSTLSRCRCRDASEVPRAQLCVSLWQLHDNNNNSAIDNNWPHRYIYCILHQNKRQVSNKNDLQIFLTGNRKMFHSAL